MRCGQVELADPTILEVIDHLARYEHTILAADINGRVRFLFCSDEPHPVEFTYERREQLKGCGAKFLTKSTLSEDGIQKIIDSITFGVWLIADYEVSVPPTATNPRDGFDAAVFDRKIKGQA